MAKDSKDFFKDLDKARAKGGCCTCQSLAIGFFALGIILGIFGIIIVRQILAPRTPSVVVEPVGFTPTDLQGRLEKAASEKGTGEVRITLTSSELTGLLINTPGELPVDELQAVVRANEIELSGLLTRPVRTRLTLHTMPSIGDDGRFALTITQIEAGTFNAPQFAVKRVNSVIEEKLAEALTHSKEGEQGLKVKDIELAENALTLVVEAQPNVSQ